MLARLACRAAEQQQQQALPVLRHLAAALRGYAGTGIMGQPLEARVSEDLLARIKDKDLVHTCGFIGGKWTQATDRATYQVCAGRVFRVRVGGGGVVVLQR
jgi:hypothetical protein